MNDFKVRQGAQVPLTVVQGDDASVSATLILREQTTDALIQATGAFVDIGGKMLADVSLTGLQTAIRGVYDYQVNENFATGDPLKYPDPNNCDGECVFPTITICEALDESTS